SGSSTSTGGPGGPWRRPGGTPARAAATASSRTGATCTSGEESGGRPEQGEVLAREAGPVPPEDEGRQEGAVRLGARQDEDQAAARTEFAGDCLQRKGERVTRKERA
ncbi:hypothetical protein THAOC_27980, partial [Thalassiosira oceanica]